MTCLIAQKANFQILNADSNNIQNNFRSLQLNARDVVDLHVTSSHLLFNAFEFFPRLRAPLRKNAELTDFVNKLSTAVKSAPTKVPFLSKFADFSNLTSTVSIKPYIYWIFKRVFFSFFMIFYFGFFMAILIIARLTLPR